MSKIVLSDVAEINPKAGNGLSDNTLVSFVPMSAFSDETASVECEEIRDYAAVKKGYTPFQNGDVLVAKITPCFENGKIGQANLNQEVGFGSTEFHVVRPRDGKSDARFLHHFLRSPRVREAGIRRMTGSAGQRRVPSAYLESLSVPPFPLNEQRRIAAILDKAEELRAKRRAAIAVLDELPQAIFHEMFGDPATNSRDWKLKSIEEIADVQGGLQVTPARRTLPEEVPYLRVANVFRGYLDLTEIKQIRATKAELERTKLEPGDLLVVEGHGNKAEIGRVATWDGSIQTCTHQNHLIRVRLSAAHAIPAYAELFLNSPGGCLALLRSSKTTSGLNTISVSDVRRTPILVPPLDLQGRFASRLGAIHGAKTIHRSALAKLDTLLISLQNAAFSGAIS